MYTKRQPPNSMMLMTPIQRGATQLVVRGKAQLYDSHLIEQGPEGANTSGANSYGVSRELLQPAIVKSILLFRFVVHTS
jgi:hypothetical protein